METPQFTDEMKGGAANNISFKNSEASERYSLKKERARSRSRSRDGSHSDHRRRSRALEDKDRSRGGNLSPNFSKNHDFRSKQREHTRVNSQKKAAHSSVRKSSTDTRRSHPTHSFSSALPPSSATKEDSSAVSTALEASSEKKGGTFSPSSWMKPRMDGNNAPQPAFESGDLAKDASSIIVQRTGLKPITTDDYPSSSKAFSYSRDQKRSDEKIFSGSSINPSHSHRNSKNRRYSRDVYSRKSPSSSMKKFKRSETSTRGGEAAQSFSEFERNSGGRGRGENLPKNDEDAENLAMKDPYLTNEDENVGEKTDAPNSASSAFDDSKVSYIDLKFKGRLEDTPLPSSPHVLVEDYVLEDGDAVGFDFDSVFSRTGFQESSNNLHVKAEKRMGEPHSIGFPPPPHRYNHPPLPPPNTLWGAGVRMASTSSSNPLFLRPPPQDVRGAPLRLQKEEDLSFPPSQPGVCAKNSQFPQNMPHSAALPFRAPPPPPRVLHPVHNYQIGVLNNPPPLVLPLHQQPPTSQLNVRPRMMPLSKTYEQPAAVPAGWDSDSGRILGGGARLTPAPMNVFMSTQRASAMMPMGFGGDAPEEFPSSSLQAVRLPREGYAKKEAAYYSVEGTDSHKPLTSKVVEVSDIPQQLCDVQNINSMFESFGRIMNIRCELNKGLAFVEFEDLSSAEASLNLTHTDLPTLKIKLCNPSKAASSQFAVLHNSGEHKNTQKTDRKPRQLPNSSLQRPTNAISFFNKFESASYLKQKEKKMEIVQKNWLRLQKHQALLRKLTRNLQLAVAIHSSETASEEKKQQALLLIKEIRKKIDLLSRMNERPSTTKNSLEDKKKTNAKPSLEQDKQKLWALNEAVSLKPPLPVKHSPFKLDNRSTYIKVSGIPSTISDEDSLAEWVLQNNHVFLTDSIELFYLSPVEDGGERYIVMKYVSRGSAEKVIHHKFNVSFSLDWMDPPVYDGSLNSFTDLRVNSALDPVKEAAKDSNLHTSSETFVADMRLQSESSGGQPGELSPRNLVDHHETEVDYDDDC